MEFRSVTNVKKRDENANSYKKMCEDENLRNQFPKIFLSILELSICPKVQSHLGIQKCIIFVNQEANELINGFRFSRN